MTTQETRELLDLAAYAIGLRGKQLADGTIAYSEFGRFNSLTNMADAFDLMVKLGLGVKRHYFEGDYFIRVKWDSMAAPMSEPLKKNKEAATMIAITRAAAAIGKQMKERQNAE